MIAPAATATPPTMKPRRLTCQALFGEVRRGCICDVLDAVTSARSRPAKLRRRPGNGVSVAQQISSSATIRWPYPASHRWKVKRQYAWQPVGLSAGTVARWAGILEIRAAPRRHECDRRILFDLPTVVTWIRGKSLEGLTLTSASWHEEAQAQNSGCTGACRPLGLRAFAPNSKSVVRLR